MTDEDEDLLVEATRALASAVLLAKENDAESTAAFLNSKIREWFGDDSQRGVRLLTLMVSQATVKLARYADDDDVSNILSFLEESSSG